MSDMMIVRQDHGSMVGIYAIGDLLLEFNRDDDTFAKWKTQAEFQAYHLDEDTTNILITMWLKGKALSWFQSKTEFVQLSVAELFDEMECTFDLKPSKMNLRRTFERRIWQVNESFLDYFHEKLILENKILIDEEEFIDYAIDGIPDYCIRDQARNNTFCSKSEMLEALRKLSL